MLEKDDEPDGPSTDKDDGRIAVGEDLEAVLAERRLSYWTSMSDVIIRRSIGFTLGEEFGDLDGDELTDLGVDGCEADDAGVSEGSGLSSFDRFERMNLLKDSILELIFRNDDQITVRLASSISMH